MKNISKILVPTDFSPLSYAVLPTVAAIANKFGAEINLLHVVETGHHYDAEQESKYFESLGEKLAEQWEIPREFEKIVMNRFVRHHVGSAG